MSTTPSPARSRSLPQRAEARSHPTARRAPVRRVVIAALATVAVAAAVLVLAEDSADAGYNAGVKYVHFGDAATACFEGQPVPCTPGAGDGMSNTIYVSQTMVDGRYHYTDIAGTAADGDVWLSLSLEAGCRADYRMYDAHVELGHSQFEGWNDPDEHPQWQWDPVPRDLAVGDKTMPQRVLAAEVSPDEVFEQMLPLIEDADHALELGDDEVSMLEWSGVDPGTAMRTSFQMTYDVEMHAEVICRRNGIFGLFEKRERHDSAEVPVRVVWLGVGAEPGEEWTGDWRNAQLPAPDPAPPSAPRPDVQDVTSDAWVTQAHLSVLADPDDACRLALSGVVVANGETDVSYRFVDDLGVHSQTFHTTVDQSFTAMLDHHVVLEPVASDGDGGGGGGGNVGGGLGFATEAPPGDGGLTAEPTDRAQGYYRLEVLSPNHLVSAVADFNVPACTEPLGLAVGG